MLQWEPDADIYKPDTILQATNIKPTLTGYKSCESYSPYVIETIGEDIVATKTVNLLNGMTRTFVVGTDKSYELIDGEYTERFEHESVISNAHITSLGDSVVLVNGVDKLAVALPTLGFTVVDEAPVAQIVVESGGFIVVFNYSDGTDIISDGWWSSGLFDFNTWTPEESNLASFGRLTESSGDISAAISFNDGIVAFKRNSMYVGRFNGSDIKWSWEVVDSLIGCVGSYATCVTPVGLIFVSNSDIHLFDGNSIKSIGSQLKQWLFKRIDRIAITKTRLTYDSNNNTVHMSYSTNGSTLDETIIYDIETNRWGTFTSTIDRVLDFEYTTYDKTIDSFDETTIDSVDLNFDNATLKGGIKFMCAISSDGVLHSLTGSHADSSMRFNVVGSITTISHVSAAIPVWSKQPIESTATHYYSDVNGDNMLVSATAKQRFNKYSFNRQAKYHMIGLATVGEFAIYDVKLQITSRGNRT